MSNGPHEIVFIHLQLRNLSNTVFFALLEITTALVLSQLDSGPSSFIGVRWIFSLIRASWGVLLASLESDELFPYIEGCPDRWSKYAPSKLKSNEDNYNYFCGREWACVPCLYFLRGLYRADDIVIIALVMHSNLSCNDDCEDCQCCHCCVDWAITSSKGCWLVPFADCCAKISYHLSDCPFSFPMSEIVCNNYLTLTFRCKWCLVRRLDITRLGCRSDIRRLVRCSNIRCLGRHSDIRCGWLHMPEILRTWLNWFARLKGPAGLVCPFCLALWACLEGQST